MRDRVRTDDGEYTRNGLTLPSGCGKDVRVPSPLFFNVFFATVIHAVLVRFSGDPNIPTDSVLQEKEEDGVGVNPEALPLACVRNALSQKSPLYKSPQGLCEDDDGRCERDRSSRPHAVHAAGLTLSEKKTEAMTLRTPNDAPPNVTVCSRSSRPEVYSGNTVFYT